MTALGTSILEGIHNSSQMSLSWEEGHYFFKELKLSLKPARWSDVLSAVMNISKRYNGPKRKGAREASLGMGDQIDGDKAVTL